VASDAVMRPESLRISSDLGGRSLFEIVTGFAWTQGSHATASGRLMRLNKNHLQWHRAKILS